MENDQANVEELRQLSKLSIATNASFDSYHRQHETHCIADTRVDLLQHLRDWSVRHERPIFWLSGMAGTGKSTISRTLANTLKGQQILGSNFFFSRGSGEANSAVNFVGTIAVQLASRFPQFKQNLYKAIEEHPDTIRQGRRNQ